MQTENRTTHRKPVEFGPFRYERETEYYSPYPTLKRPQGTAKRRLYYNGELILSCEAVSDGCGGTEVKAYPYCDLFIDSDEDGEYAVWFSEGGKVSDLDRTIKQAAQWGELRAKKQETIVNWKNTQA